MLNLYDILLTAAHLLVIGFNLIAWIFPKTRKLHLVVAGITLGCWLILGIWYGFGYCPLTDWQWDIKEKLNEKDLPASFIKYFADKITGINFDAMLIDILTAAGFGLAIAASLYVNLRKKT